MFSTLYGKLAAVLLALFTLVALGATFGTLHVLNLYSLEASQKLNRTLAAHLAAQHMASDLRTEATGKLRTLFDMQMVINPAIQIYLLDAGGKVVAASEEVQQRIVRGRVSLEPVRRFLGDRPKFPILGDDPRDAAHQRIFSVAPTNDGEHYLYVVLSDPVGKTPGGMSDSYVLKVAAAGVVTMIALALLMGLLAFAFITRKLERLDAIMLRFQASDFTERPAFPPMPAGRARDEIDRLTVSLRDLAFRIVSQVQKLRQTDQLRRELVANISHDLKTPLASLQGYVDTLLIKDDLLGDEERRSYLNIASRSCERLGKLVNDLIELAKLDAHEVVPRRESFSAAELVHDVAQKFGLKAQQRKVELRIEAAQASPYVDADIGLIERVLENLIANALAHTHAGGCVTLRVQPEAGGVAIRVSDSGIGIAQEDLEHIFERFYRANGATWEQGGNAGLGLAITKSILDLHASQMRVESQPGVGTSFTFTLPAAQLRTAA